MKCQTLKEIAKKIYRLLPKKQKLGFFLVLLILGVSAVLSQLTPLAVGYLTDHVLTGQGATFLSVVPILLAILLVNVVNEVIKVVRRLIVEDTATQAEKTARQRATLSLLLAPLSYFRSHMTGNIHGRLNRSLEGTVKLIKLLFMDFAPAVTTGLAAVVTIFLQLPAGVACLVVLVIPVGTFIVLRQISTQKGIRVELMETKADMDGTMVELLGGIETIRALDSAQAEAARIGTRSEQLRQKEMRHHKAMAFYDCLKFVNEAVFSVLVIGISVLLASQGVITVGTVLTAYLCFTQLTGPLRELHRILDELSECIVLADDYFRLSDLPLDFSYRQITATPAPNALKTNDIKIQNVHFAYPEKPQKEILDNVSLLIPAGAFVGIAGPSGCGKSSLIKVIDKLEEAQGEILLGGVDLSLLSRQMLAENVALVPQTPFLIADTVYHNICYGVKRSVSLDEVKEAAKKANIASEIEQLQGGYDFFLSEGGANLSGGQRQRIALARIFLQKPKILILDEATSALDNTSEKHIQQEIEKMKESCGTTVLSIAHRLTTLQNCDEIIVMENGRIVQRGTFAALKNTPGIFQDMALGVLK
ncbi:MAG TPA: ABC transporter ATP-binding protein [Candidatus Aphodomonas merdavium]|nr:ABC transporter ATP-binding protein [Candidatus Aphodomonas merdavium]